MSKNLVIVESPAKAKTIESYLGKDYTVKSSYGHVRDLPKGNHAIDIANDFNPVYEVSPDKKQVVSELKKLAEKAEVVWLATDDDREGEAISWHLKEALQLEESRIRRIVFREITKNAILKAIQSPRGIDEDLVNAQQARRILDRLVGFEISPLLWKKIKTGLSAGRVQSVAVRLIVEREREIDAFNPVSSFKITADFLVEDRKILSAELPQRIEDQAGAQAFLEKCIGALYAIKNLETRPAKKSPAPPFTTSTLQQEASRKMGYSVAQTMILAQKLYEAGKITYMRTDSTNLSEEALAAAAQQIGKLYGPQYIQNRRFKTKSATAQEAHEAIRPTDFGALRVSQDASEQRLYELIWKRAIASQMADAQLERTTATIAIDPVLYNQHHQPPAQMPHLLAKGEVIKFDGFLKVYLESSDDEEEEGDTSKMLPPLKIGQSLDLRQMLATERFTRPAARYTEASLVKQLEEMGIGRPSTYAPTISTIQKRGYIVKEDREGKERPYRELILAQDKINIQQKMEMVGREKSKLFPTDVAMVVNDFLVEHFTNILDYSFTATVEKEFDEIADGRKEWVRMLREFYYPFHELVEETQKIDRSEVSANRVLGKDPKSGLDVMVILGRYGAFAQIGEASSPDEKPPRASLRRDQRLDTITLEEALELFKLPREVGFFEDQPMVAAVGRFGPYIRHEDKFYSLGKNDDPLDISEERAIELIQEKRRADAEKFIKSFEADADILILNGRWGPYIKAGKKNVKIPKDLNPVDLTLEQCRELIAKAPEKKGKGGFKKKK
ncbi:MAG: type I DNA topoisomerase [Microscillaceae bacterium]